MRPIGNRIRQACEIVEQIGPCCYADVHKHMDGVIRRNAGEYCDRAVFHGLMTVDRTGKPAKYSVVIGWREMLEKPKQGITVPKVGNKMPVSSVFDLGRLYAA